MAILRGRVGFDVSGPAQRNVPVSLTQYFPLIFPYVMFDIGGMYNKATGKITIPCNGFFHADWQVYVQEGANCNPANYPLYTAKLIRTTGPGARDWAAIGTAGADPHTTSQAGSINDAAAAGDQWQLQNCCMPVSWGSEVVINGDNAHTGLSWFFVPD